MWWKLVLAVLAATGVFFGIGLYAGAWAYLLLTHGPTDTVSMLTLIDAAQNTQSLTSRQLMFLPWSWCLTAALSFLPLGLTLLALLLRIKPKTSLHGDARFANDAELKSFEYQGEYQ